MNSCYDPRLFTLSDGSGFSLTVMDVGATWLSCIVPMEGGAPREVLLAHAAPRDHATQPGYLGAVVGRYSNRIADARFVLEGQSFQLLANEGPHQLHGGPDGFSRRRWDYLQGDDRHVRLGLDSPAGDQGFPGALHVEVEYRLEPGCRMSITFTSQADAPCPVSLTSHAYFNLDGRKGHVRAHRARIAADHFLPVTDDLIPTGEVAPVRGTAFDMTTLRMVGDRMLESPQLALAGGYDHCYLLDGNCANAGVPAAEIWSSDGRLGMSLSTSYPGLQFYSGNQLAGTQSRDGGSYDAHAGIALEPQYFPDSPNHPEWPQPDCVQRPGELRRHVLTYSFLTNPNHAVAHSGDGSRVALAEAGAERASAVAQAGGANA